MKIKEIISAAAKEKTTPSRSKLPYSPDATDHWTHFVHHAESRVPQFAIDATNRTVLEAVLAYFTHNTVQCQKLGIKPQKGLLLLGPVGCGKSTIMRLLAERRFRMIPTRDVARKFLRTGHTVLEDYGAKCYRSKHLGYGPVLQYDQPITYCFDDLGVEQNAKLYGNDCNVMAEILLDRYDQFVRHGMLTHLTTNLNADEIERLYGDRVRSRLREMFNLICFPAEAKDRRK